jgi:hypothetical protein
MLRQRNCLHCNKLFTRKNVSQVLWDAGNKFCGRKCGYDYRKLHGLNKGANNPLWKGGKLTAQCIICKKDFQHWRHIKNAKTCSKECFKKYQQSPEFRSLISKINTGHVMSEEQKQKISDFHKGRYLGEKSPTWKGDDIGYRGIHDWVIKVKGTPTICEHCGIDSVKEKKRLCWANKSHLYLRNSEDWMRLCYKCHRKYDFPNEKHN